MKITNPWKCDYCSAVKGETNHWWMRDKARRFLAIVEWDDKIADQQIERRDPVEMSVSKSPRFEHICGNVCAGKALEKWLGQTSQSA